MTRRSAGSRSFLHQLAEPLPHAVAPLISRGPATAQGAAPPSTLDLIPPVLEVVEASNNTIPKERNSDSSTPPTTEQQTPRAAPRSSRASVQANAAPGPSPQRHRETVSSAQATSPAKPVLQGLPDELLSTHNRRSTQNDPGRESITPHRLGTQTLQSEPNHAFTESKIIASKPEHSTGTQVRIGTIEVRVPPPAHTPQPIASVLDAGGPRAHGRASRPTEPLARGLAWSQGLVQG